MVENALRIGSSERGLLVGQTRTGKSTLANYLIQTKPVLLVIDPKGDFQLNRKAVTISNPNQLHNTKEPVIHYQPSPEYSDYSDYDDVFRWVFYRGNTFVYVDELTAVTGRTAQSYPIWLRSLYTQGAGKGIGVLAATQRPANLPLFVFSESFRFWAFFLLLERDNKRMAEYMGDVVLRRHHDTHSFFFRDILVHRPAAEYVLNLSHTGKS